MGVERDNAFLVGREDFGSELAIFRVAPRVGLAPSFEPGQFTSLGLHQGAPGARRLVKRALSIASPAGVRSELEFFVRRVAEGEFTPALFRLAPGAGLWLDARAHGRFTLATVPPGRALLMVGAGTGVSPFVSMLRTYHGAGRWARCLLLESARTEGELAYRSQLERIAHADPSVAYHPTLTREPAASPWSGLRGRVQPWLEPDAFRALSGEALDPGRWQVMLCGHASMIAALTEALGAHGFRPHRRSAPGEIRAESFG